MCHQGHLYVFGGFNDSGSGAAKYFADLWSFDLESLQWQSLGDMKAKWPQARSGFGWLAHEGKLFLHGGYSRKAEEDDGDMEHGSALADTWCWHIADQKVRSFNNADSLPLLQDDNVALPVLLSPQCARVRWPEHYHAMQASTAGRVMPGCMLSLLDATWRAVTCHLSPCDGLLVFVACSGSA